MRIFLLLVVIAACFGLYRWQTQEKEKAAAAAALAAITPVPTPTPAPKKEPEYRPNLGPSSPSKTAGSKQQPMTHSAEIQKQMGLQGTSLDRPGGLDQRPRK